jgi:hypothetical protein
MNTSSVKTFENCSQNIGFGCQHAEMGQNINKIETK